MLWSCEKCDLKYCSISTTSSLNNVNCTNQIECVLHYQSLIIDKINMTELETAHNNKMQLLREQVNELKKVDYNVEFVYAKNAELQLADTHME